MVLWRPYQTVNKFSLMENIKHIKMMVIQNNILFISKFEENIFHSKFLLQNIFVGPTNFTNKIYKTVKVFHVYINRKASITFYINNIKIKILTS